MPNQAGLSLIVPRGLGLPRKRGPKRRAIMPFEEMYLAGLEPAQIGDLLGYADKTVNQRLREAGYRSPKRVDSPYDVRRKAHVAMMRQVTYKTYNQKKGQDYAPSNY